MVFHQHGHTSVSDLGAAYKTLSPLLGPAAATIFALSLLASGLSSSTVGTMAGQVIMQGFVGFRIPLWVRRLATMLPSFVVIGLHLPTTTTLVLSQVVLSIVLGFAVGYALQRLFPVTLVPAAGRGVWQGLGWGLVALGAALMGSAVVTFRRAGTTPNPFKPTTAFVTHGPYRFTRNPMYVGWVFVYVGAGLLARALWPLVLLPVVIFLMRRRVIALEEAYLERRFNDEYRAYRARVRRWL